MCKSEGLAFRIRFVLEFAQILNLKYIININFKHVLKKIKMRFKTTLVLTICLQVLHAQFSTDATHIFQDDTDKNIMLGTQNPGNSPLYKLFIDLRPHFNTINDDNNGIKFKTGLYAIEIDNSATSVDQSFDHPVIKPSGDYVGFMGKPQHRWFHIYGASIHGDALLPNSDLANEIGTTNDKWLRLWTETVRAKNYFPFSNNTGRFGSADFYYKELYVTDVNCINFCALSDSRLKSSFRQIEKPLEKILNLQAWQYDMQQRGSEEIIEDKIGFMAQEVEKILPELVKHDEKSDMYSLDYISLIPVMVESIKTQQEMIDELRKELEELRKEK